MGFVLFLAAAFFVPGCAVNTGGKYGFDYSWTGEGRFITHALGGIDGYSYTNSREAFEYNYAEGRRVFEVDFCLTGDGELACVHSWKNSSLEDIFGVERGKEDNNLPLPLSEFKALKVYGRYTPLSFRDLVRLLSGREDVWLVLDGKECEPDAVREEYRLVCEAADFDGRLLDRFVPQIYNQEMLDVIMGVYDWKSVIYTWYQLDDKTLSPLREIDFARRMGIGVVTMDEKTENDLVDRELVRCGIKPYVHTVNDIEAAEVMMENGVYGFYSDFLPEIEGTED